MRLPVHRNETAIPSLLADSRSFIDVFSYFYRRRLNRHRSLKLFDAVSQGLGIDVDFLWGGAAGRKAEPDFGVRNFTEVLHQPTYVRNADIVPAAEPPLDAVSIDALDEVFSLAGELQTMPFAARERVTVAAK